MLFKKKNKERQQHILSIVASTRLCNRKNKLTGRTFAGGTDNQRVVALHARGGFFIAVARAVVTVLPIVAGA